MSRVWELPTPTGIGKKNNTQILKIVSGYIFFYQKHVPVIISQIAMVPNKSVYLFKLHFFTFIHLFQQVLFN
jgi:hypothetical protein